MATAEQDMRAKAVEWRPGTAKELWESVVLLGFAASTLGAFVGVAAMTMRALAAG